MYEVIQIPKVIKKTRKESNKEGDRISSNWINWNYDKNPIIEIRSIFLKSLHSEFVKHQVG